jgi:threonyl-tRNA synthetase
MSDNKRYMQIANEMNLIMHSKSAGVVYWKPEGLKLYDNLKNYIREIHESMNYKEVKSPSIVSPELFEISGHADKYRDNMFILENNESQYALRPMSCPNHILIYESEVRSYKDLPLPLFEFGEVFRNEASGSLQVLFRQRQFCQDDSHVFVSEDNLIDSLDKFIKMSQKVYKDLGFEKIKYAIALRPEKRFGSDDLWEKAENSLKEACNKNEIQFEELKGEGAFYGPKLELQVEDKLGRSWQLGVIQLDYVLPERFGLKYIDSENKEQRPIILHHAILGSLERMIGILLESFGKDFPEFLHPIKSVVLAVSENQKDYSEIVYNLIKDKYVLIDNSSEPLGKRIRNWKSKGVPNIIVVGDKEKMEYQDSGIISYMLDSKSEGKIKKVL